MRALGRLLHLVLRLLLFPFAALRYLRRAPAGAWLQLGFAARARYVKTALEKAGVEPQVFARGAYKSAGELLVRDEMSEAQREQTERILDAFHEALLAALAERPGIGRDKAQQIVDGGP